MAVPFGSALPVSSGATEGNRFVSIETSIAQSKEPD
jgi:hypothetical protein